MLGEAPQGRAVGAHFFICLILFGGKRTSWLKPPISRSSYEEGQALRAARQPDQCRGTYHPGPRRLLDFEDEVRRTFSGTMSIKNLDEKIL